MQEFKIIDERRYPLNVKTHSNINNLPYFRFEHRVTLGYRGRRLMVFVDQFKGSVSIEEITYGSVEVIEDELFEAAYRWADERGFINILQPIWKPAGYNSLMSQG